MSENKETNSDSVTFKAPGGFEAAFRGRHLPNLLRFVIFLLLALLFVLGYQFSRDSKTEHEGLKSAIDAQAEAQRETTFIMTLSQAERETLKLTMPDSLRKRLRRSEEHTS